ncbi:MAG TPA: archaetidylserine decarboxylase [Spongiibacteraceae bacterium]|nr:archaetidylserine decarboxylase [Spongiibacteraceae bacterium]
MSTLFIASQYLLPHHLLSRAIGRLAASETPWLKNAFINWFARRYNIDMSLAANPDLASYSSFNAFFTRALRDGARPIDDAANSIVCPADGAVSQAGRIENGRILQAKGQWYSALELVGGDAALASAFNEGSFATIYLSPRDYHRVHMPLTGKLQRTIYIPGDLFSVNQTTADNVPRLFARNERLVCVFDTACGPVAVILVGAMIVAAIETVWAGQVAPGSTRTIRSAVPTTPIELDKGAEMGRFKLGSTVVLLFGKDATTLSDTLCAGAAVQMGQRIGTYHNAR